MIVQLFFAFAGGVLSFLSPCVLPLVPVYISFMSGVSLTDLAPRKSDERTPLIPQLSVDRRKIILVAIAFVLGFSTVFILLGASATTIGGWLRDYQDLISRIGGVLIIILAIHLTGLFRINFLLREQRLEAGHQWKPGPLTAYLTGMVFAFGWTPCIGPILASILLVAANSETVTRGILLLTAYSLGLGIPFLLVAFATVHALSVMKTLKRHFRKIEIASGVLLLVVGLLLVTNSMTRLANAVSRIPGIAWLDRIQIRGDVGAPELGTANSSSTPIGGVDAPLTTLDGKPARISDFRGKVVLLNYWAPFCGPCKQEMPMLSAFYERLAPKGFIVLGITLEYESVDEVKKIVSDRGVKYPVFLGDKEAEKAVPAFQGFPANFLLDQNGTIVASRQGEFTDTANLEARVNALLGGGKP